MDSGAWTAQQIRQRYEDTSLIIFRQAQKKLQRELAHKNVGSSDTSVTEVISSGASRQRLSHRFHRGLHFKTTQSGICVLL